MAGDGHSKRKVDDWFTGNAESVPEISPDTHECISEAADAGVANPSGAGESSKPKKKGQRRNRHKPANSPGWPTKAATTKVHEVALDFFQQYSTTQLNVAYIKQGMVGIDKLRRHLDGLFWAAMREDEWDEERKKEDFERWLDEQVQTCIFNLGHVAEKLMGIRREIEPNPKLRDVHQKVFWWHDAVKGFAKQGLHGAPWWQKSREFAFGQGAAGGVVFLEKGVVVVPLSGSSVRGGNGRVRRVTLQNSRHIPSHMELAGKLPLDIGNLKRAREKLSIEALVCPCTHPGVIKFFALNDTTMECYAQWWNGGTLKDMFEVDHDYREPDEIGDIGYDPNPQTLQKRKRLMAYRRNRTELAWALVCIVDAVQQDRVLHNDITPSNILLHFPDESGLIVWIGICDWGMGSRIKEETPSLYPHRSISELENSKASRWYVAPEMHYLVGEHGSDLSPSRVRKPCYNIHTDGYSVGKIAQRIWKEDRKNVRMIPDNNAAMYFDRILKELCAPKSKDRRSVTHAVRSLEGNPTFWAPPQCCYRETRKEQDILAKQKEIEE